MKKLFVKALCALLHVTLWILCEVYWACAMTHDNIKALLTPSWWLSSSPNPYFRDGQFISSADIARKQAIDWFLSLVSNHHKIRVEDYIYKIPEDR